MGTDISGFVECRAWHLHEEDEDSVWRAAIDLFFLNITRNYDAFGCLFGRIPRPRSARSIRGRPRSFSSRLIWVVSVDW